MRNIIHIILIVLLFSSCSSNPKESVFGKELNGSEIIDLSSAISTEEIIIDDIIDSMRIIQLDNNAMIGEINQLIVTDSNIYILDRYKNGSVAIFDNDGNFVKRIPTGRGPGETNIVSRIKFDDIHKTLLAYQSSCVLKYSQDGSFIKKHDTGLLCDLHPLKDGYLLAQIEGQFNVLGKANDYSFAISKVDTNFSIIGDTNFCHKKIYSYNSAFNSFFTSINDSILIARPLDSYIYNYSNGRISVKYVLDMGEYGADENAMTNIDDFRQQAKDLNKFLFNGCLKTTTNYHYLQVYSNNDFIHIFRNLKTGHMISGCNTKKNAHLLSWCSQARATYDDFFVSVTSKIWFPPEESEFNKILDNPLIVPEDKNKIRNLTENDNPLIVLYRLKDI